MENSDYRATLRFSDGATATIDGLNEHQGQQLQALVREINKHGAPCSLELQWMEEETDSGGLAPETAAILKLYRAGAIQPGELFTYNLAHGFWCAIHNGGECDCQPGIISAASGRLATADNGKEKE